MSPTVIVGAGIIGCSTAFYLSESSITDAQSIHLVESSPELFHCASGLAAGFLASDWFSSGVAPLGALSFKLHKELSEKYAGNQNQSNAASPCGGDWLASGRSRAQASRVDDFYDGDGPAWLAKAAGSTLSVISEDNSVAQVDPLRLSRFLLDQCLERGVHLHQPARVLSVSKDVEGALSSVRLALSDGTESHIPCARLVITAGAWSPSVFQSPFPASKLKIPISPLAGYSLLLKSPRWNAEHEGKGCHAVFASDSGGFSPEIFSRASGDIYIAGLNDSRMPLPALASDVKTSNDALVRLKNVAKCMLGSREENDLVVLREGLCFRPVTPTGEPIISSVPNQDLTDDFPTRVGDRNWVFMAAGHGPWGISLSLGTGKVLTDLIEGTDPPINIGILALL
ncbi:FAD dependent oxidoreductase [Aulographum hederae CBS 113979]|uniref:FAD dependent oxidoreductase n=1 Tax=Aulographum hederae CBS 113979 TaxID=1176131 RepID=A0A6G1H2C0_9PEZI|nr:FAD dependent oxidoreductase [Aulographum hederae CBS 113979]